MNNKLLIFLKIVKKSALKFKKIVKFFDYFKVENFIVHLLF